MDAVSRTQLISLKKNLFGALHILKTLQTAHVCKKGNYRL